MLEEPVPWMELCALLVPVPSRARIQVCSAFEKGDRWRSALQRLAASADAEVLVPWPRDVKLGSRHENATFPQWWSLEILMVNFANVQ